ncbi:MAG TPA: hypothetical protein VIK53_08420 [Verrucomicrobiae bacterium]
MNKSLVQELVSKFVQSYDSTAKDKIWQKQSADFRQFWSERVLTPEKETISDDDCDVVIRILDSCGKGKTNGSEAVAHVGLSQVKWRKVFNNLHSDKKLASLVDSIFKEANIDRKAQLIDELYAANAAGKKYLTGEGGNVLNALLAAYDPVKNLSAVSMKHRKALMDFLEINSPFDLASASIGKRISYSNESIKEATRALGLTGSARTLYSFLYSEPVSNLWQDTIKREGQQLIVTVPQKNDAEEIQPANKGEIRESLQMQAILADIGSKMGFQIWLPPSDRGRVLTKWTPKTGMLLEELPVTFNPTTMKTIEQIDVLWLKRAEIVRAFEVEHTTSIYSGILRMADLLAMQPNITIKLHIVALTSRREKVFQEIGRPVFAALGGRALSEICTFLSYESLTDLHEQKHLERLSDKVLEDYEEKSQEA